ncbi:MAG: CpaF family protein [Phycisphaerae bacterium]|nr:CpaF family protein [Phycisphaerae bacterium]
MERTNIFEKTVEHFLAPVMPLLADPGVSEVLVNNHREIYVERAGKLEKTDARFADDASLIAAVNNVLQYTGKRLTPEHPLADSRLPDGSRVHVVLAPLSRGGTCMTIRKFARVTFDAEHLLTLGSWTSQVMEYIRLCVLAEKNILIAGGTSSGKTCLLNAMSAFIPSHQRIVVIEDSAELDLQQNHVVSLEARHPDRWGRGEVTITELFRSALRLRPDRVIIGEVRGGEALDMIQAMTSGHAGSMSTLHAHTPTDAMTRLETLAMMSKVDLPLHALRAQIASAIDVIIQVTRFPDGRRGLTQLAEVLPLDDDGHYVLRDMFRYELSEEAGDGIDHGTLTWTGTGSAFTDEPKMRVLRDQWQLTREVFEPDAEPEAPTR